MWKNSEPWENGKSENNCGSDWIILDRSNFEGEVSTNAKEIKARTKRFALDIIELTDSLPRTRTGEVLGKQLLRAATSVGANYRAACRARSRADFISKVSVVEEESDESLYWLELIAESRLLPQKRPEMLMKEADELTAIFVASGRTAKQNRS